MSHVVVGKGKIRQDAVDLDATVLACNELGLEFVAGQTEFRWFGSWVEDYHGSDAAYRHGVDPKTYGHCKHVIRLKWSPEQAILFKKDPSARPYEIGLVEVVDGSLVPVFDNWASGNGVAELMSKVGEGCGKLMAAISKYKIVTQAAKSRGHTVKQVIPLEGGRTKIVLGVRAGGGM